MKSMLTPLQAGFKQFCLLILLASAGCSQTTRTGVEPGIKHIGDSLIVEYPIPSDSNITYSGYKNKVSRIGVWKRIDANNKSNIQLDLFDSLGILIKESIFKDSSLVSEVHFLSNGRLNIGYYSNGRIKSCGFVRLLKEYSVYCPDGEWLYYDSLGNLEKKDIFDLANHNIRIIVFSPQSGALVREENYFMSNPESDYIPDGIWKYYRGGKPDKTIKYTMGVQK